MTSRAAPVDADVLIAGGGPVGLATAIEARLVGMSAIVVEPRATPIDKACGEGLMPGAVGALRRLGVAPDGYPLTGIAYRSKQWCAVHEFANGTGLGVRRTALHAALALRAEELGVESLKAKVDGLQQDADHVRAAGVTARWLMACDGLHSHVRSSLGLAKQARRARQRRYGTRRHYEVTPWSDTVEVYWGQRFEAYVTPVSASSVGVALLGPRPHEFDAVLEALPELRARLGAARVAGPTLGAGPLLQRTSARTAGRVRLVGDAGGYVDALTGEGIRVGLAQAEAAIATLEPDVSKSSANYEREWLAVTRDYRAITRALVAVARSPLRRTVVPASAAAPGLFGAIVDKLAR